MPSTNSPSEILSPRRRHLSGAGRGGDGQRRFDLVLRLGDDAQSSAERIGGILIHTEGGAQVPLASLANIQTTEGPSTIQREWGRRRVVVQANVRGRDVSSFVADVRRALADIDLPEGYYTTLGGQFENLERAQTRLLFVECPAATST